MNSGKVFIRGTNKVIDGKKVYVIFGVIAFDDIETEKLYTVFDLLLCNPEMPPIDVSGMRADQILTSKIWQI